LGPLRHFRGGFADYLYDQGSRSHRITLGPEIGWYMFGLDAGATVELDGERTRFGVRPRIFASLPFVSFYGGECIRLTGGNHRFVTEIGVLLKYPIWLAD
jgi:hypothetical protein